MEKILAILSSVFPTKAPNGYAAVKAGRSWSETGPRTLTTDGEIVLYHKGTHWVLVAKDRHAIASRDADIPMHQAIEWANGLLAS
jgi:hypothetical protein